MNYPNPDELLRKRFDRAVELDDPFELQRLLLDLAHGAQDREWAECCCARLARHHNANVRGDALAGFGHLARRFGILDRNRVKRLIEIGLGIGRRSGAPRPITYDMTTLAGSSGLLCHAHATQQEVCSGIDPSRAAPA